MVINRWLCYGVGRCWYISSLDVGCGCYDLAKVNYSEECMNGWVGWCDLVGAVRGGVRG